MNIYFLLAGILCFIIGIVHSILGETLIFKAKRKKGRIVPSIGNEYLKPGHLRIIWATWHLASVFGWVLGAAMSYIALDENHVDNPFSANFIKLSLAAMIIGSALVLFGTKGKHPGWIGLLLSGILLLLGLLA